MYDKIKEMMSVIETTDISEENKNTLKADIISKLNCFADYFNQVVRMEIFASSISTWDSSNSFMYSQMDEERRLRHDLCVDACNSLNNICQDLGITDFYNGDIDNRHDIAAFCGVIVSELFLKGIDEERSFDELVQTYASNGSYAPADHLKEDDFVL